MRPTVVYEVKPPLIDLGDRGIVIVPLGNGGDNRAGVDALWICARAFGNDSSYKELPELPRLVGRRDLKPDNWPPLIFLPDRSTPNNPKTFAPAEAESLFGRDAHFTSAFVEITSDPVVVDIDKKLPWYRAWADEFRRKRLIISDPRHATTLSPYMLTGDAS